VPAWSAGPTVILFVRSGTAWSQQAKVTASEGASYDLFGYSVAISGFTAVVGAPNTNFAAGAAYVFVLSGGNWLLQAELTGSDSAVGDDLGVSVAVSGTTALTRCNRRISASPPS
jgi:FG-GAP repeat